MDTRFPAAVPVQDRRAVTLRFWVTDDTNIACNIFSKFLNSQSDFTRGVSSYGSDTEGKYTDRSIVYCTEQTVLHIKSMDWNTETKCITNQLYILRTVHCDTQYVRNRGQLKSDGTRAETRFRLSAKRTSLFKSAGASVQSTAGNRVVRISGSNAGYTIFQGSVKSIGYLLRSPISPSLPHPCVTVSHHISTGVYQEVCILLVFLTYI